QRQRDRYVESSDRWGLAPAGKLETQCLSDLDGIKVEQALDHVLLVVVSIDTARVKVLRHHLLTLCHQTNALISIEK
ncbi:MAG: hypothetical protein J0H57_19940, partial [Rhodospirillales bacterium]|nr:hypothetical protein [Rhodospirillales bacterium]